MIIISHKKTTALLLALLTALPLLAQTPFCCDVRYLSPDQLPPSERLANGPRRIAAAALPDKNVPEEIIKDLDGRIYHYRTAVCIGYEGYTEEFNSNLEAIHQWFDALQQRFDETFLAQAGIKLEIIRDDRLIRTHDDTELQKAVLLKNGRGTGGDVFSYDKITYFIDSIYGNANYDLGIYIRKSNGTAGGMTTLSAGRLMAHKADSWSDAQAYHVVHEIGHLFGCEHPHDIGENVEPGKGQSVMGYGGGEFFSLRSVQSMRQQLSQLYYYSDSARTQLVEVENTGVAPEDRHYYNIPYASAATATLPRMDSGLIARRYQVTLGSAFQLSVPMVERQEGQLYAAMPFDVLSSARSNALKPAYAPQRGDTIELGIRYDVPSTIPANRTDGNEPKIEFSDASRVGDYKFLLSAQNQARYATREVVVSIVDGEAFKIDNVSGYGLNYERVGRDLTVRWTPTDLYGNSAKVRIMLSKDAGQTWPYVLADGIPNSGSWTGRVPYLQIDKVKPAGYSQFINGGMLKVEIVDEIAYAKYPEQPYYYQSGDVLSKGFVMDLNSANNAAFRWSGVPEPFLTVQSADELPKAPEVSVRYERNANNKSPGNLQVDYSEKQEGNVYIRTWTASYNSVTGVYTQYINVKRNLSHDLRAALAEARSWEPIARDLHANRGRLGYPKPELKKWQEFETLYDEVFDSDDLKEGVSVAELQKMEQLITALNDKVGDNDIVKPQDGAWYKLSNYTHPFGREAFYYANRDAGGVESFGNDSTEATLWQCRQVGNTYVFTTEAEPQTAIRLGQYYTPQNDSEKALSLERGYSWGAFTLVNWMGQCASVSSDDQQISWIRDYANSKRAYRTNNANGIFASTDFVLTWVKGGSNTGIKELHSAFRNPHSARYNLQGQRVGKGYRGVVIENGKKYVKP